MQPLLGAISSQQACWASWVATFRASSANQESPWSTQSRNSQSSRPSCRSLPSSEAPLNCAPWHLCSATLAFLKSESSNPKRWTRCATGCSMRLCPRILWSFATASWATHSISSSKASAPYGRPFPWKRCDVHWRFLKKILNVKLGRVVTLT